MIYDYIIIGGGISGLYLALNLSRKYKNKTILILESKNYFGGRIYTVRDKNIKYESGAARFHNDHYHLNKLIKKYKLKKNKLPPNDLMDYYNYCETNEDNPQIVKIDNSIYFFDKYMKIIINQSKKYNKDYLKSLTFEEFSIKILNKNITKQLNNIFGYESEFKTLNCYNALQSFKDDFNSEKQFYVLQDNMDSLVNKLVNELQEKQNVKLCKKSKVINIKLQLNNIYDLCIKNDNNNINYYGKNIIFAIKPTQLLYINLFKPIKSLLHKSIPRPLLRVYAAYKTDKDTKKVWFESINRFTTNHPLRHFIPINYDNGLAMISYTDGDDALYLLGKHYDNTLKQYLQNSLKLFFPDKKINNPYFYKIEFWDEGAHYWSKNSDSEYLSRKLLYPMKEKYPNLFLCGEAFSEKQAWMEGALESSYNLFKYYL